MKRLGLTLLGLSFALYGLLLIVPILSISDKYKLLLASAIVISAESSFWISVLILGKEYVSRYRHINWRSRAKEVFAILKDGDERLAGNKSKNK